ncbi:MAG: hypothetical protein WBQ86_23870 [Candidatus Binatus sp.]
MKKHCLPVVGLLTWLLMLPPPKLPPVKDAKGDYQVDLTVPVGKWITYATYRSESACRGDLKSMPDYFACVESERLPSLTRPFEASGSGVPKQSLPPSPFSSR